MPVRLTPLKIKHLCYTWQWTNPDGFMSSVLAAGFRLGERHDEATIGPAVERMVYGEMDGREKQFGVGDFDGRCELLVTTLSLLDHKRVAVDHVVRILRDARKQKREHAFKMTTLQADRERIRQLKVAREAIDAVDCLIANEADYESELERVVREIGLKTDKQISPELEESRAVAARLKQSLAEASTHISRALARMPPVPETRLARRGRPREPWVTEARRELTRIGVSVRSGIQDDLLRAVGLTQYPLPR
jgi:hypothetical protein